MNAIFELPISIIITVAIYLALAGLFILKNIIFSKDKADINKLALLLYYLMLFVAVLSAVTSTLIIWGFDFSSYLENFGEDLLSWFLSKIGAIISTVLIIFVAGFIIKIFRYIINRSSKYLHVKNEHRKHTVLKMSLSVLNYVIKIIALLLILAVWGVNVLPALAGLGILGLVVGLGAQKLIQDFIAGFFIVFEKHFDVGDMVEINGFKGTVIDIGLKSTRVRNFRQDVRIFNNGSITTAINFSVTESLAIVEFGIAYGEDVEKTMAILDEELKVLRESIPELIDDPKCIGVIGLSDSSVDLRVTAKTETEKHYGIERTIRKEIKKILDKHGIEIPFPQVVVNQPKAK